MNKSKRTIESEENLMEATSKTVTIREKKESGHGRRGKSIKTKYYLIFGNAPFVERIVEIEEKH